MQKALSATLKDADRLEAAASAAASTQSGPASGDSRRSAAKKRSKCRPTHQQSQHVSGRNASGPVDRSAGAYRGAHRRAPHQGARSAGDSDALLLAKGSRCTTVFPGGPDERNALSHAGTPSPPAESSTTHAPSGDSSKHTQQGGTSLDNVGRASGMEMMPSCVDDNVDRAADIAGSPFQSPPQRAREGGGGGGGGGVMDDVENYSGRDAAEMAALVRHSQMHDDDITAEAKEEMENEFVAGAIRSGVALALSSMSQQLPSDQLERQQQKVAGIATECDGSGQPNHIRALFPDLMDEESQERHRYADRTSHVTKDIAVDLDVHHSTHDVEPVPVPVMHVRRRTRARTNRGNDERSASTAPCEPAQPALSKRGKG